MNKKYTNININEKKYVDEKKYINKGINAGGANTNLFGKLFEDKTNMKINLEKMGFVEKKMNNNKYGYYLKKK